MACMATMPWKDAVKEMTEADRNINMRCCLQDGIVVRASNCST